MAVLSGVLLRLSYDEFGQMTSETRVATLEWAQALAGSSRPPGAGAQLELGAVSNA